jgi:hypothetical protein
MPVARLLPAVRAPAGAAARGVDEQLDAAGLQRPSVDVRPVAELGRDPRTGKLARFVALR